MTAHTDTHTTPPHTTVSRGRRGRLRGSVLIHNSGVSTYHVRTGQQLQLPACQWMLVRETLPPGCPTLHVCIHVLFLLPPTVSDDANQGPATYAFLNLRDGLHARRRDKNEFTLGASSLGGGGADGRRGEGRGDEARWAGMRWVGGWGGGVSPTLTHTGLVPHPAAAERRVQQTPSASGGASSSESTRWAAGPAPHAPMPRDTKGP